MKKTILFIGAFLCFLSLQAQFTVEDDVGTPIEDGDVITFDQIGPASAAKLPFYITNTSSDTINLLIKFVSAVNADGSQMQLCITPGTCYFSITLGESYPQEPEVMSIVIAPGAQTGYGNYFMNLDTGNGTDPVEYVFKIYQISNFGLPIGTPLFFTYRYDPLMGTEEINKLDISVYPTLVEDVLTVETDENLNMSVYTVQGRLVKNAELFIGHNQIELSNLSPQMYLVRFENELGATQVSKVIVQ